MGSVLGKGIARLGGCDDVVREGLDELFLDRLVHQQTRGCSADLALVAQDAHVGPSRRLLNVGIVKDEEGRLAARLERDVLHVDGGRLHDFPSSSGGARKGNLSDFRVGSQRLAGVLAVAVDDVDHTGRETGLAHQVGHVEDREGRLLGRLEDNGVACCQCGAQLPGRHGERVVPGNNLRANSNGLSEGVCKLGIRRRDGLAMDLVGPAGVVAKCANDLTQVVVESDRVGLAIVPGLNGGQDLPMLLKQVSQLVHELATFTSCQFAPFAAFLERGLGSLDGNVDVLGRSRLY